MELVIKKNETHRETRNHPVQILFVLFDDIHTMSKNACRCFTGASPFSKWNWIQRKIIKYDTPSESFRNDDCWDETNGIKNRTNHCYVHQNERARACVRCGKDKNRERKEGIRKSKHQNNIISQQIEKHNWQIPQMWSAILVFWPLNHTNTTEHALPSFHILLTLSSCEFRKIRTSPLCLIASQVNPGQLVCIEIP